jgi:multidrug resistance efflux pump
VKQRTKFGILLLAIFFAALLYYLLSTNRSKDLVLVGTVDANQVIVSAKIPGRIEQLTVEEGSRVKQGDLVAVLDTAELVAQQRAAEATLRSLQSRVSESRSNQALAAGETSSNVANAQAVVQSTRAQLAQAEADLERVHTDQRRIVALADQGIASHQDRDRANADLKSAQARVQSLRDQVKAADAALHAAIARTHQANAAQSNVAETRALAAQAAAQRAEAQARLDYARVLAPVTGTVSVRVARQGEVVNPGSPIVTIVDLTDTWVKVSIPETDSEKVQLGDTVRVLMPSGRILLGKVYFKGAESDFATQRDVGRRKRDIKTVGLKVRIANPNEEYVPGMTAQVLVPRERPAPGQPASAEAQR